MSSFLIDSHCHLDYEADLTAQAQIVSRAKLAGVAYMATIGVKLTTAPQIIDTAARYDNVFAVVGVHPEYAQEEKPFTDVDALCRAAAHPKVIGLGETGLDYYYNADTKEAQRELFALHLRAAKKARVPVVIHTRAADEDTIEILKQEADDDLTGVLHCFSSGEKLARTALDLGFYLSASGIVTFKKSAALRDIFKGVPLNRLLVETDSPYLAPEPYRGRVNEPSYVVKTAEKLAEIKGVSFEELANATTENFFTLFAKAK